MPSFSKLLCLGAAVSSVSGETVSHPALLRELSTTIPAASQQAEVKAYLAQHGFPTDINFTRKEFTDVFLGVAEGFGLKLVETCVEDSLEFELQVEQAIMNFLKKDSVS